MRSLFALLILALAIPGLSQQTSGTPEAKAAFAEGQAALKENDQLKAMAAFRKAIELDPDYVEAHERLYSSSTQYAMAETKKASSGEPSDDATSKAIDEAKKKLMELYADWGQKYPKSAAVQWQLGELYMYKDYDKVEQQARKALAIDPKFTRAYQTLSLIAEVRGDEKERLAYLAKAAESAPQDPAPAFYYASALRKTNPALNRKLSLELAERFPESERGAQALYWLGFESEKYEDKVAILERLRTSFPPEKFSWSSSGMQLLFEAYGRTSPEKALALAQEMTAKFTTGSGVQTWQSLAGYQKNLSEARALIDKGQFEQASKLLASTVSPRYTDTTNLHLLTADAQAGMGSLQAAYDGLAKQMAESPSEPLRVALLKYGTKLKKDRAEVDADVWRVVEAKATPAKDFTFPRYGDEKKVSLADYRGRIVLLNLWYPFCGPCRGEAPYLQKILKKYGPDNFVILAVNVHPNEDQFVLPYLKGNAYSFIPLRSDLEWASRDYKARGYPANYLIDQQGRIVAKPGVVRGAESQRKLELQIEALLSRGTAQTKSTASNSTK